MPLPLLIAAVLHFCTAALAHDPIAPPPPASVVSPAVFRTAERYLDKIEAIAGPDTLVVFPGRSLTLISVLAQERGLNLLCVPGSGLTEGMSPEKWLDPVDGPKLEMYQRLVAQDLVTAQRHRPARHILVVDLANTGNSLLYFTEMVRKIQKNQPELASAQSVRSAYVPDQMGEEARRLLAEAGALSLALPRVYSIDKDTVYFHQDDVAQLSADAASVSKLDVLDWNPEDAESSARFVTRYRERGSPQNQALRAYLGSLTEAQSCLKIYRDLGQKKRAA